MKELELLQHGTGPLRSFLDELGAWHSDLIRPRSRPLDYLRQLALASRALIIHGNYLDDEEIAFLGAHAARMAVVYCPRTHDWFAHKTYPLEKMLAAGVTLALGTDGRSSAPDLNLWAEMRHVAQRHQNVGLDQILQMGTLGGAKALGLENGVGTLEPGKRADLTVATLPDRDARDPHELLFDAITPCFLRFRVRFLRFVPKPRLAKPSYKLFLDVEQRHTAVGQQNQHVIEHVGRFVGQAIAPVLVGDRGRIDHFGRPPRKLWPPINSKPPSKSLVV